MLKTHTKKIDPNLCNGEITETRAASSKPCFVYAAATSSTMNIFVYTKYHNCVIFSTCLSQTKCKQKLPLMQNFWDFRKSDILRYTDFFLLSTFLDA
jgi:hypothetical protein